jgi:GNAT superfamily N-acetyltransferase
MQDGYTDLPPGKIASIVTYLEMHRPPAQTPPSRSEFAIRHVKQPDRDWYRRLYRKVGEPWLWLSRLRLTDDELSAVLDDPATDVLALSYEGIDQGLLEFDRRSFPDIEITFFGVTPGLISKGAGRALFAHGLALEWKRHPQRIWLHTCTSDHPSALPFYQKFGFVAFKRAIGIEDDPRLTGEMPRTASPHIPIIGRDGD